MRVIAVPPCVAQVYTRAVLAADVLCTGVLCGAIADQLLHAVNVEVGDELRVCHVERNRPRHAYLPDTAGTTGQRMSVNNEDYPACPEVTQAALCSMRPVTRHIREARRAPQIGIGGNDGTCTEINTFAHKVATDATFLALQSLANGFERPPRLLRSLTREKLAIQLVKSVSVFKQQDPTQDCQQC